jgi:hypothetical protein
VQLRPLPARVTPPPPSARPNFGRCRLDRLLTPASFLPSPSLNLMPNVSSTPFRSEDELSLPDPKPNALMHKRTRSDIVLGHPELDRPPTALLAPLLTSRHRSHSLNALTPGHAVEATWPPHQRAATSAVPLPAFNQHLAPPLFSRHAAQPSSIVTDPESIAMSGRSADRASAPQTPVTGSPTELGPPSPTSDISSRRSSIGSWGDAASAEEDPETLRATLDQIARREIAQSQLHMIEDHPELKVFYQVLESQITSHFARAAYDNKLTGSLSVHINTASTMASVVSSIGKHIPVAGAAAAPLAYAINANAERSHNKAVQEVVFLMTDIHRASFAETVARNLSVKLWPILETMLPKADHPHTIVPHTLHDAKATFEHLRRFGSGRTTGNSVESTEIAKYAEKIGKGVMKLLTKANSAAGAEGIPKFEAYMSTEEMARIAVEAWCTWHNRHEAKKPDEAKRKAQLTFNADEVVVGEPGLAGSVASDRKMREELHRHKETIAQLSSRVSQLEKHNEELVLENHQLYFAVSEDALGSVALKVDRLDSEIARMMMNTPVKLSEALDTLERFATLSKINLNKSIDLDKHSERRDRRSSRFLQRDAATFESLLREQGSDPRNITLQDNLLPLLQRLVPDWGVAEDLLLHDVFRGTVMPGGSLDRDRDPPNEATGSVTSALAPDQIRT